jgi:hypothetical protein
MYAKSKSETHILSQLDDLIKEVLAIWTCDVLEPLTLLHVVTESSRKYTRTRFILVLW